MTREEAIAKAKRAKELGDEELELQFLLKAKELPAKADPATYQANPDYSKLSAGNRFILGAGKAVEEDILGLKQLFGQASPEEVDALRAQYKSLEGDPAAVTGGVLGKIADVMVPGGAAKIFGGYIPGVAGKAISGLGELVTTPHGKTIPRAIGSAVLGGAILGGTQPVGTEESRLKNAAYGGITAGLLPTIVGSVIGAKNFAKAHMPKATALKQLEDAFIDVPRGAPTVMTRPTASMGPDDIGPAIPEYFGVPGTSPTVGMLADDPTLVKLEQNARVRNPQLFMPKDAQNQTAVWDALNQRAFSDTHAAQLQDALNARTGALRQGAFSAADQDPMIATALRDYIKNKAIEPGVRNTAGMTVLSKASQSLSPEDIKAADLYALRKELGDKLNLKTLSPDELTNAAKSNRRLTTDLMAKIDEALNQSSGGKFSEYLQQHSQGMKPIEEGRAFNDIVEKFASKQNVFGTTAKKMGPVELARAIENETYKNMGKQGWADILSQEGRRTADDAVKVLNDLAQAQKGAVAVTGSPTATFGSSIIESAIPKTGLIGSLIDYAQKQGIRSGNYILDEAMTDPALLQKLLDSYHSGGLPKMGKLPRSMDLLFLPSAAGVPYVGQQ